ncbi:FtsK/SpoIIIE domain-containing protein [Dactylosporangium sp. CA-092794]|uniref:FtsK/SpoIIIE domain-containing protein n=1 Tax=Dactylosporangium sp. CA-092794 TaxID=3239929 RepID=UPI003D8FE304
MPQPSPDRRPVHRRARVLGARPAVTVFDLPAVPAVESAKPPAWTTVLVPVLSTGSVVFFGIVSGQRYLIWTGLIVSLAAVVTPLLTFLANRRAVAGRNERRQARYGTLLSDTADRVDHARREIRKALRQAHPAPADLLEWIEEHRLWERRAADEDFATVAVGIATVPSGLRVDVAAAAPVDADLPPGLDRHARELAAGAATLDDAPLCVDLTGSGVLGLEGPRPLTSALARAMLLEAVVCCGPDELALLVVADEGRHAEWGWATRVPHALRWTESRTGAAIATGATAPAALARAVAPRIRLRDESHASARAAGLPHLIIVVDDYGRAYAADRQPLLHQAVAGAAGLGITVLTLAEPPGAASPAEASAVLRLRPGARSSLQPIRRPVAATPFAAWGADVRTADAVAARVEGRWPVTDLTFARDTGGDLLLDLLGARVALAGPARWAVPPQALTATLGVLADGDPCRLDLRESAVGGAGPHGLLVGATGSGKSELLRTMITSLALAHDPAWLRVAFVDFKGGAAFEELAGLPHCAGLVTNIDDPALIARMRAALVGELLARQRLLAEAGPDVQNIRHYWDRRTRRPDLPPLPYLLLVIDEFAELTEADPAFLDALISIARIGRSVGMHLLLASQRLEGGRIHGLEPHLSYRIALRTFTAEESVTVIGSRVAADLPAVPGHGYLKTGPTPQRFKAAQVFQPHGADARSDLARVVAWTMDVPRAPQLWLEPLPNAARLEFLPLDHERLDAGVEPGGADAGLPVTVGLLDDPARRVQPPVLFDVAGPGGHLAVAGAPGSGKSSVLAVELLRAALAHPAYLLRFFVLDFGGGALAAAARLPNVAAYATPQEPNRVARILTEVAALLDRRAQEFQRDGVTGMADRRRRAAVARSESQQAHTVLIVDNFAVFEARCPEHADVIARVLNEGAGFGVHLHVATPRWSDLGPRRLDQIAARFELRLLDAMQTAHSRALAATLAAAGPGRALGPSGLHVQFAAPFHAASRAGGPRSLSATVERVAAEAAALHPGVAAEPLPLLEDLTAARFHAAERSAAGGQVVLGVDEAGFAPVCFTPGRDGNLLYLGDPHTGRTTGLARLLARVSEAGLADAYVVDLRGDLLAAAPPPTAAATSTEEVEALAAGLRRRLDARLAGAPGDEHPVLLVVDDAELLQAVYSIGKVNPLGALAPHLMLAQRLGLSVVLNQLPAQAMTRDPLVMRAVESGAARLQFSTVPRYDLPTGFSGRLLPPGVARLIRPGRPEALLRTLPPR